MCQFTARIQAKVIILNYSFLFHLVIDEDDSGIIISEDILEIIKDIPRYCKDIPRYNEIS